MKIAITSGKGGTWKTSITAAFTSLAKNTFFTDCDGDATDLHLMLSPDVSQRENFSSGAKAVINNDKCTVCGLCKDLCRYNAINIIDNEIHIDEFACEDCGSCSIACPVGAITIENYKRNHIYFADCRFGPMV